MLLFLQLSIKAFRFQHCFGSSLWRLLYHIKFKFVCFSHVNLSYYRVPASGLRLIEERISLLVHSHTVNLTLECWSICCIPDFSLHSFILILQPILGFHYYIQFSDSFFHLICKALCSSASNYLGNICIWCLSGTYHSEYPKHHLLFTSVYQSDFSSKMSLNEITLQLLKLKKIYEFYLTLPLLIVYSKFRH